MCGSACLPGGGAGSPDLPLVSPPPKVDQEPRPAPCEAAGGHLAGGVLALSPAELPVVEARPARVWRPRPPLRVSCSLPAPTGSQAPGRQNPPGARSRGIPRWRAVPRNAPPPPLSCNSDLETESQTDPLTLSGKRSLQTPTLLRRNARRWPPESGPHSLETAPEASQPQGRVLPFFLAFMVGPGQLPTAPHACPPAVSPPGRGHSVPAWLGSALASSVSGLGFSSSRCRPPPSSCRLTQPAGTGRDGRTTGAPGLRPAPPLGGVTGVPSEKGLMGVFWAGVRSVGKGS